jgi:hypothetical protein
LARGGRRVSTVGIRGREKGGAGEELKGEAKGNMLLYCEVRGTKGTVSGSTSAFLKG